MSKLALALLLSSGPALLGQNGYITTVAGNGTTGTSGVGGPATSASLGSGMICVDSADNLYIADRSNNRVVRVDAVTGILTLVAGNGVATSAGDGGPAVQASVYGPSAVVVDPAGNLYVSETGGNRVRRIDAATGIITTYAGTGAGGWSGDGGPATNGTLNGPFGLALDAAGNLYIADSQNFRVRRVDAATGILTTVIGNGVNAFSYDGTPSYSASLNLPMAVSFDQQGNLLVTEAYAHAIRRISNGVLTTFAGNGATTFNGDGEPATSAAIGMLASNVTADSAGNLYFADGLGRVRRVDAATGAIVTVAGNGAGAHLQFSSAAGGGGVPNTCPGNLGDNGPATLATLDGVIGVAFTSTGRLLMSDYIDCRVRSVPLPSPLQYTNTTISASGSTVTATISPIGGSTTPTGTVQFMEYAPAAAGPPIPLAGVSVINGTATIDTSALPTGSLQVMALYSGDNSYNGSASIAIPVTGGGLATPSFGASVPYPVLVSTPVTIPISVVGSRAYPSGSISLYEGSTLLSTVPLAGGVASFQYSSTITGTHQITVQFPGDSNYASGSWTFPVTVLIPSTITLTADQNPANVGTTVSFRAAVSPSSATGPVTFYDGGTLLGSAWLSGGAAILPVSSLTAGAHSITAAYVGDRFVAPANASNTLTETITAAATSLTLGTSGSPSTYGQAVTFTATITPATAAGTVAFNDGAMQLGGATLSGGVATFSTYLPAGTHNIVATYAGSIGFSSSASQAVTQTVNKGTPVVSLTSSANPVVSPNNVTFTATMTPTSDSATLNVMDGSTLLAGGSVPTGTFSVTLGTLKPGIHTMTAVFPGDANLNAATSAAISQTVQGGTGIIVTAPSGTSTFGQPVTFTATLTATAATGTIQFTDASAALGSAPISNGVATLTAPLLSAGAHSILASYNGDGIYLPNTSSAWSQTVNNASTTAVLASSLNPSNMGQAIVLSATLTPTNATGSVQFLDGSTVLATVPAASGVASFTSTSLAAGSHPITAVYSGDSNCNPVTSAILTQTVNKLATTTTLSASAATIVYGQTVNLTASLSLPGATGTIQFLDGATPLGTVVLASGSATLSVSTLAAGSHSITAVYSGDAADAASTSAAATVTVSKASAAIGLSASANPSIAGQPVTFTASVSPSAATGSVQFLDGSTVMGTASLANGAASFSAALPAGTHSVTAVYSGNANYNGATSAAIAQTVNKAPSATAISAGSQTISFGQSVALTASVAPSSATGTVQFLDGATVIGTVALSGGSATLVAGNFTAGTHTLTASYGGDGVTLASASGAVSVTVVKAATAVSLASSLNPSLNGQAVTFTAVLSPATATGTVRFQDGATVIGTIALTNGTASLTISNLGAGSHSITAVYGGDVNYNGAASAALTQSVLIATKTTLDANKSTANQGQNVKFTANISPSGVTGSVDFMDGSVLLGTVPLSGSSAVLQVSNLAVGAHSVTATYRGAVKYASSTSSAVTVTVH